MDTPDRVLTLAGVHNFRDYGGYATAGGGRLRRGVLWRSGQHFGATDADIAAIAALNLTQVYDMRSQTERDKEPCRRPEGFAAKIVLAEKPTELSAPHIAAAQTTRQSDPQSAREAMRENYGNIPYRPEILAIMRRYLAGLAEGRGASLVNCMAGKDRTGIAVVMLHLAVGVHRDDVFADYLLTNSAGDIEARIAAGIATIRGRAADLSEEVLRALMGVEAEYLETALATITEREGSVDAFLTHALGADDALRGRLREALVG